MADALSRYSQGPSLRVAGLWFWYQDEGTPVIRGLDLSVPGGQFLALLGANGSGKTTLVKHFNGLLRPRRGQVLLGDQDTAARSVGELARHVGFLFQHPEQQIFSPTVRQELAFGPSNQGLSPEDVERRVQAVLARFDLETYSEQPPAVMSYGLRRKVTLASLAAMDPQVLVLDEPTVGLDATGRQETFAWLAELHAQGRTIILVTHDMALAAAYAERTVVLQQGQILADSTPAVLFQETELLDRASLTPPPVMELAQLLQPLGMHGDTLTVEAFCDAYTTLSQRSAQSSGGQP